MTEATADGAAAPFNPWLSMWLRPRRTIRRILDTDPHRHVLLLAALTGAGQALGSAMDRALGDRYPLAMILLVACVFGPVFGIFRLYIAGWLLGWSGRWLGGRAGFHEVRAAIAWGSVPAVWASLLLYPPALLIFREELFITLTPRMDASLALMATFVTFGVAMVVTSVWACVSIVRAIAEAQGFGAWRSLAAVLLAVLLVLAPLLTLAAIGSGLRLLSSAI